MAKKNLNEKIIDAVFWTSIFLVMYLIVGFLLGSSWLSKGLTFNESYNLLKDGLSITAAFLAPVAAFILFNDWREQHRLTDDENKVKTVLNKIKHDCHRLNKLYEKVVIGYHAYHGDISRLYGESVREELEINHLELMELEGLTSGFYNKARELRLQQQKLLFKSSLLISRKQKIEGLESEQKLKTKEDEDRELYATVDAVSAYWMSIDKILNDLEHLSQEHII